jgi:hypothetical protein
MADLIALNLFSERMSEKVPADWRQPNPIAFVDMCLVDVQSCTTQALATFPSKPNIDICNVMNG